MEKLEKCFGKTGTACFTSRSLVQKKSKSGIKTPQSDKDLIRKRYNAAVSAAREEDKNERRN